MIVVKSLRDGWKVGGKTRLHLQAQAILRRALFIKSAVWIQLNDGDMCFRMGVIKVLTRCLASILFRKSS
ncbi:MAG: hypothetical protein D6820_03890 [Lentisphaerae bacterium]|nr:MAG: hypothetical protein D6820_03890 [Lentisphaerota bacterium]